MFRRLGLARASLLGERTTRKVHMAANVANVEERESHEQKKNESTRKGEQHMEAKQAMTPVAAAAAKRLIRRSGGCSHTQYSTDLERDSCRSSCCLRHPYGVRPRGLYTLSTSITSNTSRPTRGGPPPGTARARPPRGGRRNVP